MGLIESLVQNALNTAKGIVGDDLPTITWEQCNSTETEDTKIAGKRKYAAGISYKVVIEKRAKFVRVEDGVAAADISSIQFLDPVQVKTTDRITLPDGTQPQIMAVEGAKDSSGNFYAPKVIF